MFLVLLTTFLEKTRKDINSVEIWSEESIGANKTFSLWKCKVLIVEWRNFLMYETSLKA